MQVAGLSRVTAGKFAFYTCLSEASVDKKIFEALHYNASFTYGESASKNKCEAVCSSHAVMFYREEDRNCYCLLSNVLSSHFPLRLPFSIFPSDVTSSSCSRRGDSDFGLYCRQGQHVTQEYHVNIQLSYHSIIKCRNDSYNWCTRLDEGLGSFDYDNDAVGVNYYYRHYYPKCVRASYLNEDQMRRADKNKTLDINQCGAECAGNTYALLKVSLSTK